jgi:SAM-dependent methyltransferase
MLYEKIFGNVMALNRYLRMLYIIPEIQGISRSRILDIGCLDGHFTEYLTGRGNEVFAVDTEDHGMRGRLAEVRMALAEGQQLPFRNGVFDFVFCSDVLEHVENFEALAPEISRVLGRGKTCLISTVDGYWDPPIKLRAFLLKYLSPLTSKVLMGKFAIPDESLHRSFMGHVRFDISLDKLKGVFREARLLPVKERTYCRWVGSHLMEVFFSFNERIRFWIFPLLRLLLPLDRYVPFGRAWQYYVVFEKSN